MTQFDDNIIIFFADGLDYGVDDGQTNIVGSRARIIDKFLLFFSSGDDRAKRSIPLPHIRNIEAIINILFTREKTNIKKLRRAMFK